MYPSDKWTEQELQKLEKRLTDVYKQAGKELDGKARSYFKQFTNRYAKEYAAYQAGKYTKKEFEAWLMNQYGRGQRWEALCEDMARRLTESNQIAAAYINEKTPLVIALNRNFEAYMIKSLVPDRQIKEIGDIAFNLVDEHTVKRLTIRKQKILPPRRVLKSKDVHWNKKKLQNALLQGILQGDSIKKLAGRFQDVTGMNHTAAIRNARTAFTGAQNGGRQAAYEEAYQMGIDVVKHWTATKDLRTRDSHRALDGEEVPFNMAYSNGLMYPGDPSGIPAEVYNCRCTQRTALPAELAQPRMIRVKNLETGRSEVVEDMTYYEWLATQRGRI